MKSVAPLALLLGCQSAPLTPSALDSAALLDGGYPAPLAAGTWRSIDVEGSEQWLLTRKAHAAIGVVVFVHGGPGAAMSPLAYAFDAPLLEHLDVVHWDQRAAGLSAQTLPAAESLTLARYVQDAAVVLREVRASHPALPVILVGHSWGTIVARGVAQSDPELIEQLVLVGTVVSIARTQPLQHAALPEEVAVHVGPPPWTTPDTLGPVMQALSPQTLGRLAPRLGALHEASPDYDEAALRAASRGSLFTVEHLLPRIHQHDATTEPLQFQMPVTFVHGERDLATPLTMAQHYAASLTGEPDFVVFDDAAHFAMWESPRRFAALLKNTLR